MTSELTARIDAAYASLSKAIATWEKDPQNAGAREAVATTTHELRRALAAVEIALVTSERGNVHKPIPIPPHRAAMRRSEEATAPAGPVAPQAAPAPELLPNETVEPLPAAAPAVAEEQPAAPKRRGRQPLSLKAKAAETDA